MSFPILTRTTHLGLLLAAVSSSATAAPLADCDRIASDLQRLDCYDRAVRSPGPGLKPPAGGVLGSPAAEPNTSPPATRDTRGMVTSTDVAPVDAAEVASSASQLLSRIWELDPDTRRARFQLVPHHNNYLLPIRASSRPNQFPASPNRPAGAESLNLDTTELKFQFSVKVKVAENIAGQNGDLWFGYTQLAHWQVFNNGLSKPFRELNYAPELILSLRTDTSLLGWDWRMLNVGLLHESNGRSEPDSRSWNRIYAQFGFVRDRWIMMLRPWYEISESDDNPDITRYLGRGDLRLSYVGRRHSLSMLARYNLSTDKSAFQLDWAFPISGSLKGYVQVFTGYGDSLIDYNHAQTTVGIGVLLTSWQ